METNLTPKQSLALCRLMAGDSNEQAAQAVGVSTSCIEKWKALPDFKVATRLATIHVLQTGLGELTSGVPFAAKELNRLIASPDVSDRVKLQAISILLNVSMNLVEKLELAQRLEKLELLAEGAEGKSQDS